MGWRDLLTKTDETLLAPWVGGAVVYLGPRAFVIASGSRPEEHGWYLWNVTSSRSVCQPTPAPGSPDLLINPTPGYLIGDRIIPDSANANATDAQIIWRWPKVCLLEPGLERFSRVIAGRAFEAGPLIFHSVDFPLGPEVEVTAAFDDRRPTVGHIKNVSPALEQAFIIATRERDFVEKRLRELEEERRRREAEENAAAEVRELMRKTGNPVARRELAKRDFPSAAKAALKENGADLLDTRPGYQRATFFVKFRMIGQRFECLADENLRILDAGICLTSHGDDGWRAGTKGDTWFTLETLPLIILDGERQGKLVVLRNV